MKKSVKNIFRRRSTNLTNSDELDAVISINEALNLQLSLDQPSGPHLSETSTTKAAKISKSPRPSRRPRSRSFDTYSTDLDQVDVVQSQLLTKYHDAQHHKDITQILISPVSVHHMFSASSDHSIVLWDMLTKKPIRVFEGHMSTVCCLEVFMKFGNTCQNPYNNAFLFSGSKSSELKMWFVQTGKCLKTIVNAFDDGETIEIEDSSASAPSHQPIKQSWITSIALNVVDRIVYLGGYDGSLVAIRFDIYQAGPNEHHSVEFEKLENFFQERHKRQVSCIQYDGRYMYTGSLDGTYRMWNAKTGECLRSSRTDSSNNFISCVILNNKEDDMFVFMSKTNDIIFWKRDDNDEDELIQNDPFIELTHAAVVSLTDLSFHSLKFDKITPKYIKPTKYMVLCAWNVRLACFDFYLIGDYASYLSCTTRLRIGRVKVQATFLKQLTFSHIEGGKLVYHYARGNEICTLEFTPCESPEYQQSIRPESVKTPPVIKRSNSARSKVGSILPQAALKSQ
ncbi:F-box/WD repeat-containing protein [Acrasis kona]|uniref:F-box/WD repeat-containing protein n=1 Tax=Acrasis kona TaxID=1008807 RepID=A0AAW2Z6E0_9EUKA